MRLLRLLKPAPRQWVATAQRTISDMLVRDRTAVVESALSDRELTALGRALERDRSFREAFDADPVAAVDAAGWPELARSLEREMRELVALAERLTQDEAYREGLHADTLATLAAADIPTTAAEPVLRALGAPDDLLAKLPEVVAHQHEQESTKTRLLVVLLRSIAVREALRNDSRRA